MSAVNNLGKITEIATSLAYSNIPDNVGKTFSERLYYTRMKHNLTMKQLSKMANITYPTISSIEKGRNPNLNTVKKLAKALEVEPSWLGCFELLPENTLPQKIKKARLTRCLSREEAAKLIGCDAKSIFNWESGKKKPLKNIVSIIYNL